MPEQEQQEQTFCSQCFIVSWGGSPDLRMWPCLLRVFVARTLGSFYSGYNGSCSQGHSHPITKPAKSNHTRLGQPLSETLTETSSNSTRPTRVFDKVSDRGRNGRVSQCHLLRFSGSCRQMNAVHEKLKKRVGEVLCWTGFAVMVLWFVGNLYFESYSKFSLSFSHAAIECARCSRASPPMP
jgi:hypothetical protein